MKLFLLLLLVIVFSSCGGVTQDAREICKCYDEVSKSDGPSADKKMVECLELLDKYNSKYKGTDNYDDFVEEYNKCR